MRIAKLTSSLTFAASGGTGILDDGSVWENYDDEWNA